MTTIGIIGANGQVGTELCLYLKNWSGVRVVAICRSDLAAAFLRRVGIECRSGNMRNAEQARALVADCDLVADFSLPSGIFPEMIAAIGAVVPNALAGMRAGARFVYASSEMAFGMRHQPGEPFRNYRLSRSVYGASKRFGENLARRKGAAAGREVYSLRLGQVHGEMQNVSRNLLASLRDTPAWVPEGASDTVFVFSIAEALVHIAQGLESPGLYTLVSVPQWSWSEVYEYYAKRRGVAPQFHLYPVERRKSKPLRDVVRAFAVANRDILSGYVMRHLPEVQWSMAGKHRIRNAKAEIARGLAAVEYRPFAPFYGSVPGKRLKSLSDSRFTMEQPSRELREQLSRIERSAGTKLTACES